MKRWPLQEAYFWERAPFFRLLLPLIFGICLYALISAQSINVFIAVGVLSVVVYGIAVFIKSQRVVVKYIRFAALNIALIAAAWLLCYYNDIRNDKAWFAQKDGLAYTARINTEPIEKEKTWKLEVDVIQAIGDNKVTLAKGKAFVYVYKNKLPLLFHEGDTIILPAEWQPVKTTGNPFEFNYAAYCARNNIYHQQFLSADKIYLHNRSSGNDVSWISKLHSSSMRQLELYIKDAEVQGLMQAMLIGDEANLDADLRQAYAETGIIHIIAISGSHITIFFFVITFLLGWIKHKKWKWIKYLAAIPLIWVYVLMSGAPPSAVRAALMFSVLGIGFALNKQSHSLNHLLATAFVLLCAEPMWLYAIGFQLSFLAVLSLILFYRPIYKLYNPVNKIVNALWATVAASVAAEILVAPLVVYYFHLFPLLFIVANVAAYLFMGIVLIAGMLLVAVSYISPIAKMLATGIELLVKWFNELVYGMQHFNPVSFKYLHISTIELLLLYLLITGFAVYILQRKKLALFLALGATVAVLFCFSVDEWYALQQQHLVVYNISKANHIELIRGKRHIVLQTDTAVDARKKNYVLKPAHTGYGAWKRSYTRKEEVLHIAGKTVLILNQPPHFTDSFAVDYVIINYSPSSIDAQIIQKIFNPRQIILGNDIPRKKVTEWTEATKNTGVTLYSVQQQGAFIL